MSDAEFKKFILRQGCELYRDMPWRRDTRPYYILVSELMLQQTQVARVLPKFETFIAAFPNERELAEAPLAEVLRLWQGLGYNRRAKYLQGAAQAIVDEYDGIFPDNKKELLRLPGVGNGTAGAILAYVYNQPSIYIETNIRTVYIHHYFNDRHDVHDSEIAKLLTATLDHDNPRVFYWALMDYGSYLKASGGQNIRRSQSYRQQTPFAGSVRQMRGEITRRLTRGESLDELKFDKRYVPACDGLVRDGIIVRTGGNYKLTV